MSFNPEIHHRRSIRLKGYDYSQEGLYFITICVQDRECLFGNIFVEAGGHTGPPAQDIWASKYDMQDVGCVGASLRGCPINIDHPININHPINIDHPINIEGPQIDGCKIINRTPYNGDNNKIGNEKIMKLNDAGKMMERWYRELENKYPDKRCHEMMIMPNHIHFIIENLGAHVGAPLRGRLNETDHHFEKYGLHNKKYNSTIGDLVDWYKTMTTNEDIRGVKQFGWKPFDGKLWQRNYYEHIIRSTPEYERIADYITDNPAKWREDKFFRKGL